MLMLYLHFFLAMSFSPMNTAEVAVIPPEIISETSYIPQNREITVTAVGDNTIGTDISFGYPGSFIQEIDNNGIEYPYQNVAEIFHNDDLTIANLETTLTDSTKRAVKTFKFAGKPEYRDMLAKSGIDAVNLANNHIMDYLEQGYHDTIANLNEVGMGYFGEDIKLVREIKGVQVGMLGYGGWSNSTALKNKISADIAELKNQANANIVIVSFHWGKEGSNYPDLVQKDLGRYSIDCGADLVLGHHPHVVQGIETYNGRNIVYSLGNFVFGGNRNPRDKDTFIFQQKFTVSPEGGLTLAEPYIIPASVSSVNWRNNYQPLILEGEEGVRVLNRLRKYSSALEYGLAF